MRSSSLLLLLLAGCATVPGGRVRDLPPAEALLDCPEAEVDSSTNGGLAKGILDLRASLRQCNNDKLILREWAEPKGK